VIQMSWREIVKNVGGMNSIIDFIARLRENISEMEEIARESFATSTDDPIAPFDVADAKDLLDDYKKFSKSVELLFQKMIQQGEMQ
tara:strand:- start:39 stop:296 length:258 start_codon:yes stop_codon:yes gene_type:complete